MERLETHSFDPILTSPLCDSSTDLLDARRRSHRNDLVSRWAALPNDTLPLKERN